MSNETDFQPIKSLMITATLADETVIRYAVHDMETTGVHWHFADSTTQDDRNRVLELADATQTIVSEFNALGGQLDHLFKGC